MTRPTTTASAWLNLLRISNLPTVWSNVIVGLQAGLVVVEHNHGLREKPDSFRILIEQCRHGWPLLLAISFFYLAGMILNDLLDLQTDRTERPDRPLASGAIKPASAAVVMAVLFLAGLALAGSFFGWFTFAVSVLLVLAIFAYNVMHQRGMWAVLLMGACRGLIYLIGASLARPHSFDPPWWRLALPLAIILATYTVLVSLVARSETQAGHPPRRWLLPTMIALGLSGALFVRPTSASPMIWLTLLAAAAALAAGVTRGFRFIWMRPPRVPHAVMAWIAAMALIDAWLLSLMVHPAGALFSLGCFALTVLAHRRIMGS